MNFSLSSLLAFFWFCENDGVLILAEWLVLVDDRLLIVNLGRCDCREHFWLFSCSVMMINPCCYLITFPSFLSLSLSVVRIPQFHPPHPSQLNSITHIHAYIHTQSLSTHLILSASKLQHAQSIPHSHWKVQHRSFSVGPKKIHSLTQLVSLVPRDLSPNKPQAE